jgi:hypothetical protein
MSNEVYANNMELACKAGNGKSVACFPDVCFTPPENPATPPGVPIPYPNTGMASDTTDGSKTVQISGKEVMLKDKSYFKRSSGDEAGCAAKKGVVTSVNMGKIYFTAWSMDVKFEGENVVRHFDLTTHNHASNPPNTIPWLFVDGMSIAQVKGEKCKKQAQEFNDACGKHVQKHPDGSMNKAGTNREMCSTKRCSDARKCILTPYNLGCCPDDQGKEKTPHHIVPKSQFKQRGAAKYTLPAGKKTYDPDDAPCICETGGSHSGKGNHPDIHAKTNSATVDHDSVKDEVTGKTIDPTARWKLSEAEAVGAQATADVTKCPKECIEQQLRQGHQNMGYDGDDKVRPTTAGRVDLPGGTSEGDE